MQPYPKILRKLRLWAGGDKKETGCTSHQTCCIHARPSPSRWWCPWVCPSWGEWSGIDLIFIDAGVKINDAYYCEVLLTQKLLPVMCEICSEFFIFQQGNVSAYRARGTINLLKRDTCVRFTLVTQQHRSEPDWLQNMGRNASAALASSLRRRTEAELDRCLASFQAKRHRWRSWPVAQMPCA